jgi:formyl-CoA transferase
MVLEQGNYKGVGTAIKFSRTPASFRRLPPRFGEHSREVLQDAGFSAAEIDALVSGGIVPAERRKAR